MLTTTPIRGAVNKRLDIAFGMCYHIGWVGEGRWMGKDVPPSGAWGGGVVEAGRAGAGGLD